MENRKTEIGQGTGVAKVTSDIKVLAIGDSEEKAPKAGPDDDSKKKAREDEFRRYFCFLLTGSKKPIKVVEDWDVVERFGAASVKEGNQPRRYHFLCKRGMYWQSDMITIGPTFNAKDVLNVVRERLKDENWISEDIIETPLRTKFDDGNYYSYDQYIQQIVSQSLDVESKKIFNFLLYLHRSKGK